MCYFVLFWVNRSRNGRPSSGLRKFRFFEQAVLVKFAIVEKKTSSSRVPPMMRTLSINRLKHHLPKWKVISLFLPPTIFDVTLYLSHYMQKERVAWHPKERLPMKLAAIRSENIEVYISFNNSIQGNGQKLNEWDIGALTTSNDKMWQNIISIA